MWGTGRYRRSNVCLAYTPLASLASKSQWRFFSDRFWLATDPSRYWTGDEKSAAGLLANPQDPKFGSPELGELSVAWVSELKTWLMLHGDAQGIVFRTAPAPWGPWTGPRILFQPGVDASPNVPFGLSGPFAYAPYIIPRHPQVNPGSGRATIYYTLSSTDPNYQSNLARVVLKRVI